MTSEIADLVFTGLLTAIVTVFVMAIYFFEVYLGNHPDRAIIALRERKTLDHKRLEDAAALFEGMDHPFHFPKGFENCEVDDDRNHMVALYEDGRAICYYCGVVAEKIG